MSHKDKERERTRSVSISVFKSFNHICYRVLPCSCRRCTEAEVVAGESGHHGRWLAAINTSQPVISRCPGQPVRNNATLLTLMNSLVVGAHICTRWYSSLLAGCWGRTVGLVCRYMAVPFFVAVWCSVTFRLWLRNTYEGRPVLCFPLSNDMLCVLRPQPEMVKSLTLH